MNGRKLMKTHVDGVINELVFFPTLSLSLSLSLLFLLFVMYASDENGKKLVQA